tara:strand:- start:1 stop:759 length:759 start_codon:yes stop_codon:yes gene_type:complete
MTARALKKRNNMAPIFGLSKNLGKGMDLKRSEIKGLKLTNKPKFTLKAGSNNPNRQEVSGVKKATIGSALKGVHDKLQGFGKRHSAWKAKRKAASVGADGLTSFQRRRAEKKTRKPGESKFQADIRRKKEARKTAPKTETPTSKIDFKAKPISLNMFKKDPKVTTTPTNTTPKNKKTTPKVKKYTRKDDPIIKSMKKSSTSAKRTKILKDYGVNTDFTTPPNLVERKYKNKEVKKKKKFTGYTPGLFQGGKI